MNTLIDFAAPQPGGEPLRLAFGTPRQVLAAHALHEVRPVLEAVQAQARQGRWCVGYLRYEAAPAFDAALSVHAADGPLAWFGVHDAPLPWPAHEELPCTAQADWDEGLSRAGFDAGMAAIHRAIAAGELYQLNYTTQLQGRLQGRPHELFRALRRAQPGGYAAFLDTGTGQVLSVSPELFFDWDGECLLARPMKGTAPRGATPADDAARAEGLRASPKERAENVMIVDLIRNDLSRVARPYSVQVPRLFDVQVLPSVWQMTSDVQALTREGVGLADVFAALFPCGSVTGAPKVQAMRRIRELEPAARGVYCGAIGVVRPGGAARFNVPIRTVTARDGQLRCGIGSGITADATAEGEWQEWRHKRAFVERASEPFELLETLALQDGALRDAEAHLARLGRAAAHFGYPWPVTSQAQARRQLQALAQAQPQDLWRVRLRLDAQGRLEAEAFAMAPSPERVRLQLAATPFEHAGSEFVRFKTSRRAHYDAFAPVGEAAFDTLLWNLRGELTECTRGNIALQLDGRWLTPVLSSGLLDGVGRAHWLGTGRLTEAVLRVEDLRRAQGLAFINSLRGWIEAELA